MATYQDLINVGGEIRTKQGRKFKDPTELAGYLGIDAKTIQWGEISKQETAAPAPTPYEGLTQVGQEVQTKEGRAFASESELAQQHQWSLAYNHSIVFEYRYRFPHHHA